MLDAGAASQRHQADIGERVQVGVFLLFRVDCIVLISLQAKKQTRMQVRFVCV